MRIRKYLKEQHYHKPGKTLGDLPFFRSLTKDEKNILLGGLRHSKEEIGVYPDMETLPYFKAEFAFQAMLDMRRLLNEKGLEIVNGLVDKFEAEDIV